MKTLDEFEFEFLRGEEIMEAHCFVFLDEDATEFPYMYPMYRVSLLAVKTGPPVFVFYNTPDDPFFYYKTNIMSKDQTYKFIHHALVNRAKEMA